MLVLVSVMLSVILHVVVALHVETVIGLSHTHNKKLRR